MKPEYITLINAGRCKVDETWRTAAHNGLNRLYYINGGKGGYIKNGKRINFCTGMLYLIPYYANIIVYTDLEDNLDHSYVGFLSSPPILSTDVLQISPAASDKVDAALTLLLKLAKYGYGFRREPKPSPREDELTLLKATIAYLSSQLLKEFNGCMIKDQTVISALNMMTEDPCTKVTIADIAQMHGMSTNGFIKLFTRCVGETPYSYLKNLKIQKALMLRAEGVTLEKTAEACGYSDASALLHAINSQVDWKP